MNDSFNPYRPPSSEVFDRAPPEEERIDRPRHVFIAVALLWVTLVMQAAGLAFMWRLYRIAPPEFLVMFGITTAAWVLTAWLVAMVERGRNWARWTCVAIFPLSLPFVLLQLGFTIQSSPVAALLMLLQLPVQIAALVMLFIRPAGAWFRGEPAQ
jgi:hypothetical protein